ncbi:MAG TPA: efflux RND transporter periplasmic adaptor subunit [Candidatus Melainabacteria bacterium]|nr:efflux RND transporter periplasmic adaptor subunit [Candidatus Melainabacteria bacterium]
MKRIAPNRFLFYTVNAFVLLATCLSSCTKEVQETGVHESALQEVPVVQAVKKTLFRVDQLPGEIQAYQDVAIYPKVPGFIDWIGVDRGSKVKKGQLMVTLTAPELLAQRNEAFSKAKSTKGELHEAEAKLASARAMLLEAKAQLAGDTDTYKRTKEASLVPGVVAPNDVVVLEEKVEADKQKVRAWQENVLAAENSVRSMKDSLTAAQRASDNYKDVSDYLKIYAPFDGYVTERNMHVGSFVGPLGKGAYPAIVRVQQLDLLRIITPVPETNAGGVLPGASVEFTVSTHPGERFTGSVARIGNYLDQKTRTMPVELNYENPGWRVLPGMFCEVYWPTRRKHPSIFVPPTAVETTSTLSTFVCRIRNDETEWIPVRRGEMMQDLTEVFGNLEEGDFVALHCTDALKPHTKVKPIATKIETASTTNEPRPSYNDHGTVYSIPDKERSELSEPENRSKPKAY